MTKLTTQDQRQRDKETGEPDDATSIKSGSEGGWEKRPEMDLARQPTQHVSLSLSCLCLQSVPPMAQFDLRQPS
jgi:hypothetical protein